MTNFLSAELLPFALAACSGVLMAVQGSFNSVLSKSTGILEATFIVHLVGAVGSFLLLFLFKIGQGNLAAWSFAPWYTWLGGLIGVGIVYLVASSIPSVGVANATTAIIVGQVAAAVLIDHFGGFGLQRIPFSANQLIGVVLLAVGAKFLLK